MDLGYPGRGLFTSVGPSALSAKAGRRVGLVRIRPVRAMLDGQLSSRSIVDYRSPPWSAEE
jgi:hypothetical protein